ncbi:recombinase family protein [Pseudomaricurvus alkylphenolicus]|uniref:recombinase family protein n=1 Tax=Pseudomaricurvus alkylphenolicus TaxID=1306991 RepID=UPI0014243199|nr:recombinase family protein [Pseudomaricurvus alkylphenolicus]NIB42112.1 recombinase family protein [Pseudomaricurvus alkylphenolicus]
MSAIKGQKVGYARVSSYGQSLESQLDKLAEEGCEEIFQEKRSGTRADNRPVLQECLKYVRKGDLLVVCKLDRLARSVADLHKISEALQDKGVGLNILDQKIDTTTNTGRLMFNMLGAIAEFENDLRKERQLEGIEKAKEKGVKFGVKKTLSEEQVEALRADIASGEKSKAALAQEYGISRATLYRYLSSSEKNTETTN